MDVKGYKLWYLEPGYAKCLISRVVMFIKWQIFKRLAVNSQNSHEDKKLELEVEPAITSDPDNQSLQHDVSQQQDVSRQ